MNKTSKAIFWVIVFFALLLTIDQFLRAMRAEGVSARGPGGSVILPTNERIEKKVTVHADWPSFNSPAGKAFKL